MSPDAASGAVRRLSVTELQVLLRERAHAPLIDVREDYEYAAGHLPQAIHIPLAQLPARLAEFANGPAPMFICRSGGRSMAACQMAQRANISAPANIEGGMTAWATQIDPDVRVA
jgi:rhodanese-related sulfurtransferase